MEDKIKKTKAEDFFKKYEELCMATGYQLVVNPEWLPRDDGTFSMRLQMSVAILPGIDKVKK